MTNPTPPTEKAQANGRRALLFACALAVVSLALVMLTRSRRGAIPWTDWALPALIAINCAVLALGGDRKRTPVMRVYWGVSIGLALVIVAAEIARIVRR